MYQNKQRHQRWPPSLGSVCRRLGYEGKQGALCSCLMFMLPDEVCALFQSWNLCLNVTSGVLIFIHDDDCLLFLFPHQFIQSHRLVLVKHLCPSLFYSHIDGSFLMPHICAEPPWPYDPDTSEESWLLEKSPEPTEKCSCYRWQVPIRTTGSFEIWLL